MRFALRCNFILKNKNVMSVINNYALMSLEFRLKLYFVIFKY